VSIFTPILYALWLLVEVLRLYIGYTGNLREQTGSLASFLFLSFFPQFFITIYMLYIQDPILPIDLICNYIYLCTLIIQIIATWRTISRIIAHKTARFQIEFGANDEQHQLHLLEATSPVQPLSGESVGVDTDEEAGLLGSSTPMKRVLPKKKAANTQRINQTAEPTIEMTTTQSLPQYQPPSPHDQSTDFYSSTYNPYSSTAQSVSRMRGTAAPLPPAGNEPTTPTAASFNTSPRSNETEDERIQRRMRDRAIIRGEFDRKRSRPGTATSAGSNTEAVGVQEESSQGSEGFYATQSSHSGYLGRAGVKKSLTSDQILAQSQSRRAAALLRREYPQQTQQPTQQQQQPNQSLAAQLPQPADFAATPIALSTSTPQNIEIYQRILNARRGRDEIISRSAQSESGGLVAHTQTADFTTNPNNRSQQQHQSYSQTDLIKKQE
jgi:hypothetical protein